MLTLHLYCRIGDVNLGEIASEYPPRAGDLLLYRPPKGTEFESQETWRVEGVSWQVATPGSPWTLDRIRAGGYGQTGRNGTVTETLDVLVWPERGPFWTHTPEWARRFTEEEEPVDD